MSNISITLDVNYCWVILSSAVIALQVVLTGFAIGGLRKKLNVPYPDMGNGRFAAKLEDKDWETFNNYQRAHYNYVEQVSSAQTFLLLGGLFHPIPSASLGLVYILGRQLYTWGYRAKGASGRMAGALILDLALLGMFGTTVYGSLNKLGFV